MTNVSVAMINCAPENNSCSHNKASFVLHRVETRNRIQVTFSNSTERTSKSDGASNYIRYIVKGEASTLIPPPVLWRHVSIFILSFSDIPMNEPNLTCLGSVGLDARLLLGVTVRDAAFEGAAVDSVGALVLLDIARALDGGANVLEGRAVNLEGAVASGLVDGNGGRTDSACELVDVARGSTSSGTSFSTSTGTSSGSSFGAGSSTRTSTVTSVSVAALSSTLCLSVSSKKR